MLLSRVYLTVRALRLTRVVRRYSALSNSSWYFAIASIASSYLTQTPPHAVIVVSNSLEFGGFKLNTYRAVLVNTGS